MRSTMETTLTSESIDRFRNWCIAKGQSENTAKAYATDLTMFLAWTEITSLEMQNYETQAAMWLNATRKEMAPKTTGRRLTSLRTFAKWAGFIVLEEYRAPKPGKQTPHPIPERLEGLNAMLDVCRNAEQRALVGLCGFAGLRIGEALDCSIKWFDINDMILRVRGKGDKERFVPVSESCWSAVSSAYTSAVLGDGKLIHYQDRSARVAITEMGRRAGLSRSVASHDLRATFATVLGERGVQQRIIQELLGHANGATTELYLGFTQVAMREAVEL